MKCSDPYRFRLWQSHLGLAHKIVIDHLYNRDFTEDARQEVMLALWEATSTWQESVNSSFEHYAFYVMRGRLFKFLTEKAEDKPTLSRKERDVLKSLREHVKSGQSLSCAIMAKLSHEYGLSLFRLNQIVAYWYSGHAMLTASVFECCDDLTNSVEDMLLTEEQDLNLSIALSGLNERERMIIAARYLDDPRKTLSELSKLLNISMERVRVIEGKCLNKLREKLAS